MAVKAKPLTKAQWKTRKDRGKWSYQQYRTWFTKNHPGKPPPTAAPYDPTGGAYFRQIPEPILRRQATQMVNQQINPLLDRIEKMYQTRSLNTSRNIRGYHDFYNQQIAQIPGMIQGSYDTAMNQQRGIDSALTSFLTSSAAGIASGLGSQLAAADQGHVAPALTAGVNQLGAGAAVAAAATGSSTMSRLAHERAAELGYAHQLPMIGAMEGARTLRRSEMALNEAMREDLGQITDQIPTLTNTLYQSLLDREFDKAVARQGFLNTNRQLTQAELEAQAAADADAAKAAADAMKQNKVDEDLSAAYHYLVDEFGNYILDENGQPIPYTPYEKPTKPTTANNNAAIGRQQRVMRDATRMSRNLYEHENQLKQHRPIANERAYAQVYAYVASFMPNASPQQIWAVAQRALAAGGYLKAASIPDYAAWTAQRAARAGTPPAGAARPAAPAEPPPVGSPDARDANARARERGGQGEQGGEGGNSEAYEHERQVIRDKNNRAKQLAAGGASREETFHIIMQELRNNEPSLSPKRRQEIARAAVANAYGP